MRGVVRASVSPQQNQSACPSSSRRNSVDFHLGSTRSVTQRGIRDNTISDQRRSELRPSGLRRFVDSSPSTGGTSSTNSGPTPPGGALAKTIWFKVVQSLPAGHVVRCRFWDCGGSEKQGGKEGDPTVGALAAQPATGLGTASGTPEPAGELRSRAPFPATPPGARGTVDMRRNTGVTAAKQR
jgi:hypothetical protein